MFCTMLELVHYDVMASCKSTDPRKMTNNLLKSVFGTEYLGTHSLTGNAGSKTTPAKPALDAKKVVTIIGKYFVYGTQSFKSVVPI